MSFLKEIQGKMSNLRSGVTEVTLPSGQKFKEWINSDGIIERQIIASASSGFVVDTEPDLQVAMINNYLCLSSQDPACDVTLLQQHGITHVLSLGVEIASHLRDSSIIYKQIQMLDVPETKLNSYLDECLCFINSGRSGKVLVHCNAGVSRSPSVVIAYLIKAEGMSFNDAFSLVKSKRYIRPNEGFLYQLRHLSYDVSPR